MRGGMTRRQAADALAALAGSFRGLEPRGVEGGCAGGHAMFVRPRSVWNFAR